MIVKNQEIWQKYMKLQLFYFKPNHLRKHSRHWKQHRSNGKYHTKHYTSKSQLQLHKNNNIQRKWSFWSLLPVIIEHWEDSSRYPFVECDYSEVTVVGWMLNTECFVTSLYRTIGLVRGARNQFFDLPPSCLANWILV